MTRKDFELIANAIKPLTNPLHSDAGRLTAEAIAKNLANALAKENPRFDRPRFLAACGVA